MKALELLRTVLGLFTKPPDAIILPFGKVIVFDQSVWERYLETERLAAIEEARAESKPFFHILAEHDGLFHKDKS